MRLFLNKLMGLWSKVKGVFGRIGNGLRSGYDWLSKHKDTITTIADGAASFLPNQYQAAYGDMKNKINDGINRYGAILR